MKETKIETKTVSFYLATYFENDRKQINVAKQTLVRNESRGCMKKAIKYTERLTSQKYFKNVQEFSNW